MTTYVCPQCGPDPAGADAHAESHHTWPPGNVLDGRHEHERELWGRVLGGVEVYPVVIEHRHTGVQVSIYSTWEKACDSARAWAAEQESHPERIEEELTTDKDGNGLLLMITYGLEEDSVWASREIIDDDE